MSTGVRCFKKSVLSGEQRRGRQSGDLYRQRRCSAHGQFTIDGCRWSGEAVTSAVASSGLVAVTPVSIIRAPIVFMSRGVFPIAV
jgi:hypothetical protein